MKLLELKQGQTAKVLSLDESIEGEQRRRLYDLGILPGTKISIDFENAFGDPIAYNIRNTIIALRNEHALNINIEIIDKAV